MNWYDTVFEVIDTRSFSSIWYWIAVAVLWSSVSHWVLGVPFDLIARARRSGPRQAEAQADLSDLVRVNVNRLLYISEVSGAWLGLFGSAILTALLVMAVLYSMELAQAVLFLAVPMAILGAMSVGTARRIQKREEQGAALIRRLMIHRFLTQLLGVVAIFVTALFGMYKNVYVSPYGF